MTMLMVFRAGNLEMVKLALLVVMFTLLIAVPLTASAESSGISFSVHVYSDGSAAIAQSFKVNASAVSITVPLITSVITNVLATDQNGSPLSFQISGQNITVYTIGATEAIIQYDTDSLTSKQGSVWMLAFTTSYNLTVTLPQHSSLISVSDTPTSLSVINGYPVIAVSPGNWTIKYGVPLQAVSTTSSTTSSSAVPNQSSSSLTTETTTQSSYSSRASSNSSSLQLGFAVIILTVLVLAGYLLYSRRNSTLKGAADAELRPDDIQVLDFISEKGGKVFEQEIRTRFALPKTSTWRQIKRLERLGYVRVLKIGSQNQIELLRKRD